MLIKDALSHAASAARGSLSDLGALLRALLYGAVYDEYAGNPNDNVTPVRIGQLILDTTNNVWYKSTALTSSSWSALGSSSEVVQRAVVAVSTAELKALAATPKTLIAAPGSGYMILPERWRVRLIDGTTAFDDAAADGDLTLEYGGGTVADTMEADGLIDATADTQGLSGILTELITAESNLDNKALTLSNDGTEFTGATADATAEVEVFYRVVATNPS